MWKITTYRLFWGWLKIERWTYEAANDVLQRQGMSDEDTSSPRWYAIRKDVQYSNGLDRVVRPECEFWVDNHGCTEDLSIIEGVCDEGLFGDTESGRLLFRSSPQQD